MKTDISPDLLAKKIHLLRGHKVMMDEDLSALYGVPTKSLNLAVKRNRARFPSDFMFQMTPQEYQNLRFQIETSNKGSGGRRYMPYVFTEQGVAMLSSVLKSKRAVQVNILIMRAFVRVRELLSRNKELMLKLNALIDKVEHHDADIDKILDVIERLTRMPSKPNRRIGFHS